MELDASRIDVRTKDVSISELLEEMKKGCINAWDLSQESQFIESILVRIPLSTFYFDLSTPEYPMSLNFHTSQRLSTLRRFFNNEFSLCNLEFMTHLNGKKCSEIEFHLQRRIKETMVPVFSINPGVPEEVRENIHNRIRKKLA